MSTQSMATDVKSVVLDSGLQISDSVHFPPCQHTCTGEKPSLMPTAPQAPRKIQGQVGSRHCLRLRLPSAANAARVGLPARMPVAQACQA